MNAGEYVGKDGRTWKVKSIYVTIDRERSHMGQDVLPTDPDYPAAKAALDALIAEQDAGEIVEPDAGEWVVLPVEPFVGAAEVWVSRDGERWRTRYPNEVRKGDPTPPRSVIAYCAGLAQGQKVRDEAVRELVAAIESNPHIVVLRGPDEQNMRECVAWIADIKARAAKVKL